jgi:hypothetical protein
MEDALDEIHNGLHVAEHLRLGRLPRLVFRGGVAELAVDAEREQRDGSGVGERLEATSEEARGDAGEDGGQSHDCLGPAGGGGENEERPTRPFLGV